MHDFSEECHFSFRKFKVLTGKPTRADWMRSGCQHNDALLKDLRESRDPDLSPNVAENRDLIPDEATRETLCETAFESAVMFIQLIWDEKPSVQA